MEVLTRGPRWPRPGKRYTSRTRVFGWPLVHVALGPHGDEIRGKAKGIIAVGDVAFGCFAAGGAAFGIIAMGGVAIGLVALGGGAIGLLAALGGGSIGGLAVGGAAIGGVAQGGGAVGVIADGGGAVGYLARGGGAYGVHTITFSRTATPQAQQLLNRWAWLIGPQPGRFRLLVWVALVGCSVALLTALVVAAGYYLTSSV